MSCLKAGKDATDDFEDVGHSGAARSMMDEYYVGDVDLASLPSKPTYTPAKQATYNSDKSSDFLIKILQFLVPHFFTDSPTLPLKVLQPIELRCGAL